MYCMWTWFRAVRSFESYARISCIWKRLAQDSLQVHLWNNPKLLQVPNSSQNALHLPHPWFIIVIFQSKLFLIFSLAVNDLQRHFLPFTCTVVSTIFSFQLWFTTFKFEKFVAWIENWCVNFCHKYIWEWPVQVMAEPKSVLLSGILGFCLHFSFLMWVVEQQIPTFCKWMYAPFGYNEFCIDANTARVKVRNNWKPR